MDSKKVRRAVLIGVWFQVPGILCYIAWLVWLIWHKEIDGSVLSPWMIPAHIGTALFVYCLVRLYTLKAKDRKLLTTGPFRYTRHPMYTGLALMMTGYLLPVPATTEPVFFILPALSLAFLTVAAYWQEQETLARFGKEAEEYYARTPRLFFMYPFMRHAH